MSERYVLYFYPWFFSVGLVTMSLLLLLLHSSSWQVFNLTCSLEFRQSVSPHPSVSSVALLSGWGGTHWDEFHLQLGCVCAIYGLKYQRSIFISVVHCELCGGQGSREWPRLFSPLAVALCQYQLQRWPKGKGMFCLSCKIYWFLRICSEKRVKKQTIIKWQQQQQQQKITNKNHQQIPKIKNPKKTKKTP